jgi:hypothetical protein
MEVTAPAHQFDGVASFLPAASSGAESRSRLSPRGLHFIHNYLEWQGRKFHNTETPHYDAANVDPPMPVAAGMSPVDSQPPPPLEELDY